ncbi:selenium cofactor biosynthesis protein YqeC [Halodesulfovibrio sp.]|uniref:selenium cofactor biosynthesis protein YqeC n=1 Tax=Halodesulfovibrio sp. TaxID=1912772 RepID=UPI0025C16FD5|nr:selenium cofactor biosynthesis protein YqeC [Halodesulfovibrio sp.]
MQDSSSLNNIFPVPPTMITLIGAGGKTSIMYWLAQHFSKAGKRIIVTTTTKMFPPKNGTTVLQKHSPDFFTEINNALTSYPLVTVAESFNPDCKKLIGLSKQTISKLCQAGIADCILVEADGAARKPLKAPNTREPVIPAETNICIGVMGLDAVFSPLTEENVHRSVLFSKCTECMPETQILPEHLIALADHPNGLFQFCPSTASRYVFLNKADLTGAKHIINDLRSQLRNANGAPSWYSCSVLANHINPI